MNSGNKGCVFLIVWTVLAPLHAYQPLPTFLMPMRDGIRLATDVYLPGVGKGPWPTVLVRTPYGRKSAMDPLFILLFTDIRGYALAFQDLRGRGDSEGVDSLFLSDGWGRVRDGYDAIEGTAEQSWCNGTVGTWGYSGLGIPVYLASGTRPPHLSCCCVMVAASNLYEDAIFYGGVYQKSLVDGWLSNVKSSNLGTLFIQHANYESLYDVVNLSTRWDSVNVPMLHVTGWHDMFVQGVINAFAGLQDHGGQGAKGRQKLLIGPWVHDITSTSAGELTFPNSSYAEFIQLQIDWFDHWIKNADNGADRMPPVRYYLMGDPDRKNGPGNRWVTRTAWPPSSVERSFYLASGRKLSMQKPPPDDPPDRYVFDPKNPVPTRGGRNLNIKAGSYDQRSSESRSDVLVYTTESLLDSLTVTGRVAVTLWASSDAVDTDFSAKLCDVYPDGRSMLIADGIVQARHRNSLTKEEFLLPGQPYAFAIDLWSTAVSFAPGHSIRLDISSSNDPRFEPNPNTGEPFRKNTGFKTAHQTVYHDPIHASALRLPVVESGGNAVRLADGISLQTFGLGNNYPNPFNSETVIPVTVPESFRSGSASRLTMEITDMLGRRIRQWTIGQLPGKTLLFRWRGDDASGRSVPSGIYFCRLTDGTEVQIQKMTLLR